MTFPPVPTQLTCSQRNQTLAIFQTVFNTNVVNNAYYMTSGLVMNTNANTTTYKIVECFLN